LTAIFKSKVISMRRKFLTFIVLSLSLFTFNACAYLTAQTGAKRQTQQTATQPDDLKISRPTSEPYTGDLSIFEDPKRAERLQINRVMDILGIKKGAQVADIGAGGGWFTVRAAARVGSEGRVYAVDINKDYLNYIENRAKRENLTNVQTILGTEDDPKLPPASLDAVLILKTYHEIAQPVLVLSRTRAAMKKDALLGIIDRNGNGADHGIARETVIKEAARAGFKLYAEYDFVKPDGMDYFLVFHQK
jgi:2-polyprenyl-3-methyl-5-hydroxy-6-metoxy-1,4-benzoquinol methylase